MDLLDGAQAWASAEMGVTAMIHSGSHDSGCSELLQMKRLLHQLENVQKACRATTPSVPWSVALLHIFQVVPVLFAIPRVAVSLMRW